MNHPMRRADRKVTSLKDIRAILEHSKVLHLGLHDEPYVYQVPLNFGYTFDQGKMVLFIHSAKEGRKIDLIQKNPNVSVEMDCNVMPMPGEMRTACTYSCAFDSIMAQGKAVELDDPNEKAAALQALMAHTFASRVIYDFSQAALDHTAVFRIDVEAYSAKHHE